MKLSEFTETSRISFEALSSNKLRSFLTTLGVVIGIMFVILMGWFLNGLDTALDQTFNTIGTDMLYVDKWNWSGGRNWRAQEARKDITYAQAVEFCKRVKTAENAMPQGRAWGRQVLYKNQQLSGISIMGVQYKYAETPAGNVIQGRFFSQFEELQSENVAVVGFNVSKNLFPDSDAVGKILKIGGRNFTIIGVIEKRGTFIADFMDNQIYVPLSTFFGVFGSTGRSISIAVKAGSEQRLDVVRSETIGLMRAIRNNKPGAEDDFSINESQMFKEESKTLRMSVWGIGLGLTALSFIVGMIGIMNIMFVTVTERTKEIGIRKALGATRASILVQFLMEAAALCFVGAMIAYVLCSGITFAAVKAFPSADFLTPYVPPALVLIAAIVSIVVGIVAGLVPSMRAARMNPVDALRYE
ncbi:MAG: ABC transporter permease [Candidatus Kapaibacterium sp.]